MDYLVKHIGKCQRKAERNRREISYDSHAPSSRTLSPELTPQPKLQWSGLPLTDSEQKIAHSLEPKHRALAQRRVEQPFRLVTQDPSSRLVIQRRIFRKARDAIKLDDADLLESHLKELQGLGLTPSQFDILCMIFNSDNYGRSLLAVACQRGAIDVVQYLLTKDIEINTRDRNDWTPLHDACTNGSPVIVKILLQNGARVNASSKHGNTPLCSAAAVGSSDVALLLLDAGANIEGRVGEGFLSPLQTACRRGHESVACLLLARGAAASLGRPLILEEDLRNDSTK